MRELISKGDEAPAWRDRLIGGDDDTVLIDHYPDRDAAVAAATALNPILRNVLLQQPMDPESRRALELKRDKALQSKQRLQDEETLMLAEALRRHSTMPRPDAASLQLDPKAEQYRDDLATQLAAMPYLRVAQVGWKDGRWREHKLLFRSAKNTWSEPYYANKRAAVMSERAKIANGFELDGGANWATTKGRIRKILLPRANQLLQLASVQRLLAEAFARGERVLVSNGIVFWYEPDGSIGWQVKEVASSDGKDGESIWREGTILSTNHGRLVILPFIKENGERVRGHTKNAPGDGKAFPRHPDHYVEIPFSMYSGDLMIGLFGELPYE
ncbi:MULTISPECIES: hypothetical protein [Asticcacaulis]|uniref:hypothetical protein n=1 Tax=Asticcacaulis TaxID=76890 RepID=UPI001AEAEAEA|nr:MULTISPECIES: hypothetical protein [Asticcacaulis]MBP2159123.1 hypothetical protein [Asticcacaulis solisilvae]MDR6800168.1 hypothetical protein [Asticcacaulis sp. BE141]